MDQVTSMKELNDMAESGLPGVKNSTKLCVYFRSAANMLKEASFIELRGDLETAYVLYVRYVSLITKSLPAHSEWSTYTGRDMLESKQKAELTVDMLAKFKPKVEQRLAQKRLEKERIAAEKRRIEEEKIALERRKEEERARMLGEERRKAEEVRVKDDLARREELKKLEEDRIRELKAAKEEEQKRREEELRKRDEEERMSASLRERRELEQKLVNEKRRELDELKAKEDMRKQEELKIQEAALRREAEKIIECRNAEMAREQALLEAAEAEVSRISSALVQQNNWSRGESYEHRIRLEQIVAALGSIQMPVLRPRAVSVAESIHALLLQILATTGKPHAQSPPSPSHRQASPAEVRLKCAAGASEIGPRSEQEDRFVIVSPLTGTDVHFFGVYDGHGGSLAAEYCARHLHKELLQDPKFSSDKCGALVSAFVRTDKDFLSKHKNKSLTCGCTAVVALLCGDLLYVASAGDSRCLVGRWDKRCVALTKDHLPTEPAEEARITRAGGKVTSETILSADGKNRQVVYRVNDRLMVTRAIGDGQFKASGLSPVDQAVSPCPAIQIHRVGTMDQCMILACDGVFEVMNNQQTVDFLRETLPRSPSTKQLEAITYGLVSRVVQNGGTDNTTAVVAAFGPR